MFGPQYKYQAIIWPKGGGDPETGRTSNSSSTRPTQSDFLATMAAHDVNVTVISVPQEDGEDEVPDGTATRPAND